MYYGDGEHGVLSVFLSRLSAYEVCETYCLTISRLLVHGAFDKLPVRVPDCYANPGLTDALVDEKLKILIEQILKFFKSEPRIFDNDCRKAGAVAKAVQSRPAHVIIGKKDARLILRRKSGQQSSSSQRKSAAHSTTRQYQSQPFVNSTNKDKAGVNRNNTESRTVPVSRAKEGSKDSGLR